MRAGLGSRRRFLYRVSLYSLAPLVGLYVFWAHTSLEGRLLGLSGLGVGTLALYLLFARLKDPGSAIRYALRPVPIVLKLLERWQPQPARDPFRLQDSLRSFLREALPDVTIEERHAAQGEHIALSVGEEVLIYLAPSSLQDIESLREILEELRTPLREEPLLIVYFDAGEMSAWATQLAESMSRARLLVKRS